MTFVKYCLTLTLLCAAGSGCGSSPPADTRTSEQKAADKVATDAMHEQAKSAHSQPAPDSKPAE